MKDKMTSKARKKEDEKKKITCCVPTCSNSNLTQPPILFFPFPKRVELRKVWLNAINRPDLLNQVEDSTLILYICKVHFNESDTILMKNRKCLKSGVAPSVKLPIIKKLLSSKSLKPITQNIIDISCGALKAEMYLDKFYCPGVHRECILYNNQWVTPKMFMIMGDKWRSKDWRGSIKMYGSSLRKYLDMGMVQFHKHDELCSGHCNHRMTEHSAKRHKTHRQPPQATFNHSKDISHIKFLPNDPRPVLNNYDNMIEIDHIQEEEEENLGDGKMEHEWTDGTQATFSEFIDITLPSTITTAPASSSNYQLSDNQQFWSVISKLHLLVPIMDTIRKKIMQIQCKILNGQITKEVTHMLSSVIRELDLSETVEKMLIDNHKSMNLRYKQLEEEMAELRKRVNHFEVRRVVLEKHTKDFEKIMEFTSKGKNLSPDKLSPTVDDCKSPTGSDENINSLPANDVTSELKIVDVVSMVSNTPTSQQTKDTECLSTEVNSEDSSQTVLLLRHDGESEYITITENQETDYTDTSHDEPDSQSNCINENSIIQSDSIHTDNDQSNNSTLAESANEHYPSDLIVSVGDQSKSNISQFDNEAIMGVTPLCTSKNHEGGVMKLWEELHVESTETTARRSGRKRTAKVIEDFETDY